MKELIWEETQAQLDDVTAAAARVNDYYIRTVKLGKNGRNLVRMQKKENYRKLGKKKKGKLMRELVEVLMITFLNLKLK